jgi:hypothetical protein
MGSGEIGRSDHCGYIGEQAAEAPEDNVVYDEIFATDNIHHTRKCGIRIRFH